MAWTYWGAWALAVGSIAAISRAEAMYADLYPAAVPGSLPVYKAYFCNVSSVKHRREAGQNSPFHGEKGFLSARGSVCRDLRAFVIPLRVWDRAPTGSFLCIAAECREPLPKTFSHLG